MSMRTAWLIGLGLAAAGGVLYLALDDSRHDHADGRIATDEEFVEPAALTSTVMDEETAKALFPGLRRGRKKVFDPVAWTLLAPDRDDELPWPEAPAGSLVLRTNNLGFREDQDTLEEKSGFRILVVGDSHTEGVVANAQSFANVLERLLVEDGGEPVEVINGGVGGTGPYSFLGVMKKYAYLQPDMVIATLYNGNDIMNALTVSDFFSKRESRRRHAAYQKKLIDTLANYTPLPQGFNQAYYLAFAPEDIPVALEATVAAFQRMADYCAEHEMRFAVLLLPSKPDVDTDDSETVTGMLASLDITRKDLAVNLELARRAADLLRARGVSVVDPTEAMRAVRRPLYWKSDHHLNIAGHALVAQALREELFP